MEDIDKNISTSEKTVEPTTEVQSPEARPTTAATTTSSLSQAKRDDDPKNTKVTALVPPPSFTEQISQYRQVLEDEFHAFENSLNNEPHSLDLEQMDWADLEKRYEAEISAKIAEEEKIINEIQTRFQQFMLWMQVSNEREAERAIKRLRTRMAFVQESESALETRHEHYAKVLQAFQSAMALLNQ